tara:strand:- start:372 stop:1181 length:810 start_codon:yes stop_codon:yes gene_type:complete
MKIKVKHQTTYHFDQIVPRLIQSIKLYPSKCKNQKIINWNIHSDKGNIIESHQDSLGHKVFNIFNKNFKGKQVITSNGVIETKDYSGLMKGLNERVDPLCFLRQTKLTEPCEKIFDLSNKVKKNKNNVIKFCHDINLITAESIKYVAGSTSTNTSAKKSIEQGRGVCQDFAHILISLARLNNIPARYINGFLLEDLNSQENFTHAWVEMFIKDLGWVAFDPSHKKCIDDKYIRISCGQDFLDASTIKGIKTNYSGKENLNVKISVSNCQ